MTVDAYLHPSFFVSGLCSWEMQRQTADTDDAAASPAQMMRERAARSQSIGSVSLSRLFLENHSSW